MNHQIYLAEIFHQRMETVSHRFQYRVPYFRIDLKNIRQLESRNRFFSYNKPNIFSLWDKDYLDTRSGSILESLRNRLDNLDVSMEIDNAWMITVPRFFLYVFNPVNFYYCFDHNGQWSGCVAEVNNTFGEKHLYAMEVDESHQTGLARFLKKRDFHVSPFIMKGGDYEFFFEPPSDRLDVRINIKREGKVVFHSSIKGDGRKPVSLETVKIIGKAPVQAVLSMSRILYEAARLYYLKKVNVYQKPVPESVFTIKEASPGIMDRIGRKAFDSLLSNIASGSLQVTYPNGETKVFKSRVIGLDADINIREWYFFGRLMLDSDIGFAESYIKGEWETGDLTRLISLMADNSDLLSYKSAITIPVRPLLRLVRKFLRRNNREGAKRNIQEHYDLGNDFFSLFLDKSMMYSCGVYETGKESLEESQENKLDRLISKARIRSEDHVLEIGTGWGGFSIRAAKTTGCKVTTVTISKEQFRYAKARIAEEGLQKQIRVLYSDYRDLKGKFDKIVSIEMLEAIGHEQLPVFFKKCDRLLSPDGLLVLQVITMPEQRYRDYLKHSDFIEKFIFPGAVCPSLSAISSAACEQSRFLVESAYNIGPHYARTLRQWRERFLDNKEKLDEKRFDSTFMRTWLYYLCYCEAGFGRRAIGNYQLTFTRANNKSLIKTELSLLHESD